MDVLVTSCQLRMARAALKLSVDRFAQESGVSAKTIRRLEAQPLILSTTTDTIGKVRSTIERLGFILIPVDDPSGHGPGIYCDEAFRQIVETERAKGGRSPAVP